MKIELTPAQICHLASILAADAALMEALSHEYGRTWSKVRAGLDRRILAKLQPARKRRRGRKAHASQLAIMRRKPQK